MVGLAEKITCLGQIDDGEVAFEMEFGNWHVSGFVRLEQNAQHFLGQISIVFSVVSKRKCFV